MSAPPPDAPHQSFGPFRALRLPHFGAVWSSNVLQFFGSQVQLFALQWLVTDLTASRAMLGLVTSVQGAVVAVTSPVGGVAADRLPKRNLLIFGRLGVAAGVLGLIALMLSGHIALWQLFVFAAAMGLLTSFTQTATQTYVFDVVGREHAQPALALNSAGMGLGQMGGPALAGILVASVGVVGSWLFAVVALTSAAALLISSPVGGRGEHEARAPWRELREGFAFVIANRPLLLALIACSMAFFNGALFAMRPVFARHVLEVGSEGMGVMAGFAGLGSLLGALGAALLPTFRRPGIAITASMLAFSVCIFLYAFAFSFPYILGVEFASGLAAQFWQISAFSGLQMAVPERMRGRVMGILFMVVQLALVGGVFVGSLADRVGDQLAMGIFGAIPMAITLAILVFGYRVLGRLESGGLEE